MWLPDVVVDTASMHTWVPATVLDELGIARERVERFMAANGSTIERSIGFAITHVANTSTATAAMTRAA